MLLNTSNNIINDNNNVEYLYVYAGSYEILFLLYDRKDGTLYKVITDKGLNINYYTVIGTPEIFKNKGSIVFFKYKKKKSDGSIAHNVYDYILNGLVIIDGINYRFAIEDEILTLEEGGTYIPLSNNLLTCTNNTEVKIYNQRGNNIFVIGYSEDDCIFYGVIDIEKDIFTKLYYLTSDIGDIYINSLSADLEDEKVYLAGYIKHFDSNTIEPYLELFGA